MNIYPSAAIRQNYNKIADLCRETGEPVFLTKKGKGDLVVLDIDAWERERKALEIREGLLQAEARRLAGEKGYTIEETLDGMRQAVKEAADHGQAG